MRASKPPRAIAEAVEAFLLQKRVNGCSPSTVSVYKFWLNRFAAAIPDAATLDTAATTKFFATRWTGSPSVPRRLCPPCRRRTS